MRTHLLFLLIGLVFLASPASAQVDQLLKGITGSGVTDNKASAGLKEALEVATEKAVSLTGRPNGYFGDAAIKILMPAKLQTMQEGLRAADRRVRAEHESRGGAGGASGQADLHARHYHHELR